MIILIQEYHLKVASSLSINVAAGFLLTIPAISNRMILTGNIVSAILCLVIALKIEKLLQEL